MVRTLATNRDVRGPAVDASAEGVRALAEAVEPSAWSRNVGWIIGFNNGTHRARHAAIEMTENNSRFSYSVHAFTSLLLFQPSVSSPP